MKACGQEHDPFSNEEVTVETFESYDKEDEIPDLPTNLRLKQGQVDEFLQLNVMLKFFGKSDLESQTEFFEAIIANPEALFCLYHLCRLHREHFGIVWGDKSPLKDMDFEIMVQFGNLSMKTLAAILANYPDRVIEPGSSSLVMTVLLVSIWCNMAWDEVNL
ncbi:hypothetical protein HDU76_009621 [Blyttiomyces sp. JEL0837]|nr:hypothetical protein HDU76_009621 [Blyttiomyces sp. JEL0837]